MLIVLCFALTQADASQPTPLTVSPAAAPVPSLKFELLPRASDQREGNAAIAYYQSLLLRPPGPADPAKAKMLSAQEEAFHEKAIGELSARELTEFLKPYRLSFAAADQALRYSRCDWQREHQLSGEGLFVLMPELQQHRELARLLALRVRLATVENKFDEAAGALKSGLQHAKHVGEGPSLISLLVGLAMANVHLKRIEDVIQRPDSPNMYWALTTLPRPFIDPKPGLDGEESYLRSVLPGLKAIESGPVTADQATQAIDRLVQAYREQGTDAGIRSLASKVGIVGYASLYHAQSKKELMERGSRTANDLDAMPPVQIVLLRGIGVYRELMDDRRKLFSLPYSDAVKQLSAQQERLKAIREGSDPLAALFSLTVPAVEKVYDAFARTERRIAILQAIEAIRLHVAAKGSPPARLADVTIVPVPVDPNTGKPFEYAADGQTIRLLAPPPEGQAAHAVNSMGYQLTFRK
jgi:hypothetical protein